MEMLPYLGYAVAFIAVIYALISKKRLENLNALLTETSSRYQASRADAQLAESKVQKAEKETADTTARLVKLEKQKEAKDDQYSTLQAEHEKALHELNESLARSKDHHQAQQKALTDQLSEAIRDKHQALEQLSKLESQKTKLSPKQLKDLEAKLNTLSDEHKRLKSDLKKAQHLITKQNQVLKVANPKIVKKLQIKVSKLETLYASMKGLREMSEERNQNWETALRYMAAHINPKGTDATGPIGEVVGQALARLGAQLVVDDEQTAPDEVNENENMQPSQHQVAEGAPSTENL